MERLSIMLPTCSMYIHLYISAYLALIKAYFSAVLAFEILLSPSKVSYKPRDWAST